MRCRAALIDIPEAARFDMLRRALDRALSAPALYHAKSFANTANASRIAEGARHHDPASARTSASADVRAVNHELLAAAGVAGFTPLPVRVWDLLVLFLVWCGAAATLALMLWREMFERTDPATHERRPAWRFLSAGTMAAAAAGMIAGLVVLVLRLIPYLIELTFSPCTVEPLEAPLHVLTFVPWLLKWLAGCNPGQVKPWLPPGRSWSVSSPE